MTPKGAGAADRGFARAMARLALSVHAAPRLTLLLSLLFTVLCGLYSVEKLSIDTDTAGMISEDLPFRQRYKAFKEAFPDLSDNVAIVIEAALPDRADEAARTLASKLRADPETFPLVFSPETDPFFLRNGLLYLDRDELQRLADDLADAQGLLAKLAGDPTLRGLAAVLADAFSGKGGTDAAKDARLSEFLDRLSAAAEAAAAGKAVPVSWQTLVRGEEAKGAGETQSAARRIILTRPKVDFSSLSPAAEAMDKIRALAREAGLTPEAGVSVRLTGGVVISTEELESVAGGAETAGLVSLVLVAGLLVWGIRSARLVAAILAALLMGLVWTAGFTTLAVGHLNLVSVAFAVLFIGLGVDFGIHFALRFREERLGPGDDAAALERTGRALGGALGLCALAAAVSFFSFVPTAYRGLSELGLIAGAGMFIAFAATFVVMPAVLALLPTRTREASAAPSAAFQPHRGIAVAALLLGVACIGAVPFARFDLDPIKLRDPATESVRTFRDLAATPGASPYTIEILADSLSVAYDLSARLRELPEVDSTVTAADLVPRNQEDKIAIVEDLSVFLAPLLVAGKEPPAEDDGARAEAVSAMRTALAHDSAAPVASAATRLGAALAALREDAARQRFEEGVFRYFTPQIERLRTALDARPVALADLPAEMRDRYLSAGGRARLQVYPRENLEDPEALARFVEAVRRVAPDATDSPVEILEAGRAVVGAVTTAALISIVTVTVMIFSVLRSVRDTLMVLIPLVLAALYTVAATVLLDMPFNFANVIVLPLLMGLGAASGIHLVARAREERSGSAAFASSTPRAVVFSALTTIASFGSLAISSHRGTASMGELLTLSIALTLVCTLIVLPALMRLWPAVERPQ
jgi:hopanoid biosynthesis associated RND transporter like protein HpnN